MDAQRKEGNLLFMDNSEQVVEAAINKYKKKLENKDTFSTTAVTEHKTQGFFN
ncbi:MAG: hypothetical protein U9O94_05750 [Nanoarchaeota archaeon]|nr:hypothetical protein [Nanoarchaeota archaeon]